MSHLTACKECLAVGQCDEGTDLHGQSIAATLGLSDEVIDSDECFEATILAIQKLHLTVSVLAVRTVIDGGPYRNKCLLCGNIATYSADITHANGCLAGTWIR